MVFFSDKVLLVEGIADKVIYEKMLMLFQKSSENWEAIEVLMVDGMENFKKFRKFLNQWEIRNFIIADKGYESVDKKDLFILKKGNIEDYFGGGHFKIKDAIGVAEKITDLNNVDAEMKEIFTQLLES